MHFHILAAPDFVLGPDAPPERNILGLIHHASLHANSSHDLSLVGALALGRSLGLTLPDDEAITIVAVEVEDVLTFGERCTPAVQAAIPRIVQMIIEEVVADLAVSELNSGEAPDGAGKAVR